MRVIDAMGALEDAIGELSDAVETYESDHYRLEKENALLNKEVEVLETKLRGQTHSYPTEGELSPEMRARLMPEGMSWPRFEDGEPVTLGSFAMLDNRPERIGGLAFRNTGGFTVEYRFGASSTQSTEYRLEKPMPLDCDGELIEAGDTVYAKSNGEAYKVVSTAYRDPETGWPCFTYEVPDDECAIPLPCREFTHERPAPLDAHGVPIEVGDTVWDAKGQPFEVGEPPERVPGRVYVTNGGAGLFADPSDLTHRAPEPAGGNQFPEARKMADSWEKLEEEVAGAIYSASQSWGLDNMHDAENDAAIFVRRAKALAGGGAE